MKRLLIYCIYDKDGIVDDYILYFLNSMRSICEEICVVVNGNLSEQSKIKLEKFVQKVIVRENIGFDSSAYKTALETYGFDKIKTYDELILANDTVYGPIYDIGEVFSEQSANEKIDFWGITRHPKLSKTFANQQTYPHIQSYFLVFKNTILSSKEFENFWGNLKVARNYDEAIGFFELKLTNFFEQKGFKSNCLIDMKDYIKDENSYLFYSNDFLKTNKLLFIKKRIFNTKNGILKSHIKKGIMILIEYLDKETSYDTKLIYKNIRRCFFKEVKLSKIITNSILYFLLSIIIFWKRKHYINKFLGAIDSFRLYKKLKTN